MAFSSLNNASPRMGSAAAPSTLWVRDDRYSMLITAMVWVLIVRMIIPGNFDYSPEAAKVPPGAAINLLIWWGTLGVSAILIASRSSLTWLMMRWVNVYYTLFFAFATASIVWSIDPSATVRTVLHGLTIILDCFVVTIMGWHATRFQTIVRPVLTVLLVGSIIFGLVSPDLAITPPTPEDPIPVWHGLTSQKNQLGGMASFGVILWAHGWLSKEVKSWQALIGTGAAVACLLLSRSATSTIVSLLVVALLLMMMRSSPALRAYMPYIVSGFVALVAVYALAILRLVPGLEILLDPVMSLTGKNATFSDRSRIWEIISDHIKLSPYIGSGFGGYWVDNATPANPSFVFYVKMFFYPWSAHNGYLDIINDLGFVGILIFFGYVVVYVRQSLLLMRENRSQAALYLGLLFEQMLGNLSESHWFTPKNVDFLIMTLATVSLARGLLESRLRFYYGNPFHEDTKEKRANRDAPDSRGTEKK